MRSQTNLATTLARVAMSMLVRVSVSVNVPVAGSVRVPMTRLRVSVSLLICVRALLLATFLPSDMPITCTAGICCPSRRRRRAPGSTRRRCGRRRGSCSPSTSANILHHASVFACFWVLLLLHSCSEPAAVRCPVFAVENSAMRR